MPASPACLWPASGLPPSSKISFLLIMTSLLEKSGAEERK